MVSYLWSPQWTRHVRSGADEFTEKEIACLRKAFVKHRTPSSRRDVWQTKGFHDQKRGRNMEISGWQLGVKLEKPCISPPLSIRYWEWTNNHGVNELFDGDTMGYVPNMIISDSEGDDMIMEGFHQQRHGGIKSANFNGIYPLVI